jgi:predicted nucleic acid binding AN1-type Zn finger protein
LEEQQIQKAAEENLRKLSLEELQQESIIKQTDTSKCWSCQKKAGLLGYKCKCGYTYCKKHRLPESHTCEFDFIQEGKTILQRNNPAVVSDKIEKI